MMMRRTIATIALLIATAMLATACHDWPPWHGHDEPVPQPTAAPTAAPTVAPTVQPTAAPTSVPPTPQPTVQPTVAPTAVPTPPSPGGFVETFDGNTGLDRFGRGVWHRDNHLVAQTQWSGDHDLNCGTPDTQRIIRRSTPAESFYVCRDHMMTSVGDTSGYSIAWFSPAQTFPTISEVCWDVNLTQLGSRQWWKVAVITEGTSVLMSDKSAAGLPGLTGPDRVVASWGGESPTRIRIGNGNAVGNLTAGADKMTRYPGCLTDNRNGTVTFSQAGPAGTTSTTAAGALPPGPLRVVFQDHNYNPTKNDPTPPYNQNNVLARSTTWHWDNIVVRP